MMLCVCIAMLDIKLDSSEGWKSFSSKVEFRLPVTLSAGPSGPSGG